MAISYLDKKPSRLWNIKTNTIGLIRSFRQDDTKTLSRQLAREVGTGAGILAAAAIVNVTGILVIPFVPLLVMVGGIGGGFWFGREAKETIKQIKKANSFREYVNRAETKWLAVQNKGGPLKYALWQTKRLLNKIGTVIGPTVGIAGTAVAATAGLTMANILPVAAVTAAVTTVLPAVALTTATLATGIAIGAVAMTAGFIMRGKCRKNLKELNKKPEIARASFIKDPEPTPLAKTSPTKKLDTTNTVQQNFSQKAANDTTPAVTEDLSEERRLAAEKRAATRAARNKKDNIY